MVIDVTRYYQAVFQRQTGSAGHSAQQLPAELIQQHFLYQFEQFERTSPGMLTGHFIFMTKINIYTERANLKKKIERDEATIANAESQIESLKATIVEKKGEIKAAKSKLTKLEKYFKSIEDMFGDDDKEVKAAPVPEPNYDEDKADEAPETETPVSEDEGKDETSEPEPAADDSTVGIEEAPATPETPVEELKAEPEHRDNGGFSWFGQH